MFHGCNYLVSMFQFYLISTVPFVLLYITHVKLYRQQLRTEIENQDISSFAVPGDEKC